MPALDKESWFAFLALLKKNRPRQPINGVIVAISLEDLDDAEPGRDGRAFRPRSEPGCSNFMSA